MDPMSCSVFRRCLQFFAIVLNGIFFVALKEKILIYALSFNIVNSCFHATMAAKGNEKTSIIALISSLR